MKNIIIFLLLLFSININAQEVISSSDTIIQIDGYYFKITETKTENGSPYPNTSIDTVLIDSSQVADELFDLVFQIYISVEDAMENALKRRFAIQKFNEIAPIFQAFTGITLQQDAGERYFGQIGGRYRVTRDNGTFFFANIIQVNPGINNALRLIGETGEGTFLVNAKGPDSFQIVNFEGETLNMYWDGESIERKLYWTSESIDNNRGFRMLKVQ